MRVSEDPTFADAPWQTFAASLVWPLQINPDKMEKAVYAQFRDWAGNVSPPYSDSVQIDRERPLVHVEVLPGDSLQRVVQLYAYDATSDLSAVRMTNDPFLLQNVVTVPYTDSLQWP